MEVPGSGDFGCVRAEKIDGSGLAVGAERIELPLGDPDNLLVRCHLFYT
jgi:hypothetical protein